MQKTLTVGELIDLALQRTDVPEAASWIGELRNHDGGKACHFGSPISKENIAPVCYGISLKVVTGLKAITVGAENFEARGHKFLATVHVLAEGHGVNVSLREVDSIGALKNVLTPL